MAMHNPNEISFVHPNVSEKDRELFGFDTGDEHIIGTAVNSTTGDWMLCHLMHFTGLFPSVSAARKMGGISPFRRGFLSLPLAK